jgi:hypothetical protein
MAGDTDQMKAPAGAATATAPATRGAPPPSATDLTPGTTYLDQQTYLNAKANPEQLKRFLNDWITLGGRGIIGGDGKPASYWDVYQDLAHDGIDLAGLPAPESLVQGNIKNGGATTPMSQPAPTPAPTNPVGPNGAPVSQELTDLLKKIGVNYENAPAPTPGLMAFLRQLDMGMSTAEDTKRKTLQLIGDRETTGTEDISRAAERTKQNVTADLIRRGVLQSGEATGRYARGAEDRASKITGLTQSSAEGRTLADTAYGATQQSLRSQALDKVLQTETEQASAAGQSAAQKKAADDAKTAAELDYQRRTAAETAYRKWYEEQIAKGVSAVPA